MSPDSDELLEHLRAVSGSPVSRTHPWQPGCRWRCRTTLLAREFARPAASSDPARHVTAVVSGETSTGFAGGCSSIGHLDTRLGRVGCY